MNPNSSLSVVINAINSSVRSLFSSIGLLNCCTVEEESEDGISGPINRLPNEILQLIMAKLGLDDDVKKLIRLRLVSTRWTAVIEDYCGLKKSLIVAIKPTIATSSNYYDYPYLANFEKRFFGSASLNDFTRLVLSAEISVKYLKSLLNLFPNVVRLSIYCKEQLRVRDLFEYIKSLDTLKQLDLIDEMVKALPHLSQTLSKLEHIAFTSYGDFLNKDELYQFISHLGPKCVRFNFEGGQINEHILQWHSLNPTWLFNVTHLRITNYGTREWHSTVVHQLTEHATSLKYFKANFYGDLFGFAPTMIGNFGKLAHLVELNLWNVEITELEHAAVPHQANSQSPLLVFKLYLADLSWWNTDDYIPPSGDQFARILSVTFPNLVELDFSFDLEFGNFYEFTEEIEHNLYRFPKLRKHKIDYGSYDDKY